MPADTFLSAEDVPVFDAALERLRQGADVVEIGFRTRTDTAPAEWLEARFGAIRGHKGSPTGFVAVSRVVTTRVGAEQPEPAGLAVPTARSADAVPGMTAWVVDRDLTCRFAAGTGYPALGGGSKACVDRPLAQLLSADRFETVRRRASRSALPASFRPKRTRDRAAISFWSRYLPITTSSGTIEEVLVLNLELTDRERTHEALRRSEASFSSAFDNSPIGMAIIAPDGSVRRANDAFCALTRRSRVKSCTAARCRSSSTLTTSWRTAS